MAVRVGTAELILDTPTLVRLKGRPYLLCRNEDGDPILFEAVCPHAGGTVEPADESCLRCPNHGWEFDEETGESINVPGQSLESYPIEERGGHLFADIPDLDQAIEFTVDDRDAPTPTVTLLAHATLSIEYEDFTLLTDPWLDGPAFLGGWTQYPAPTCDIDRVVEETDAIWITHEHSDHLNPRTLEHFPGEIPIYVPELNYRRLNDRLSNLGFERVHSLPTGSIYPLADGIEAVCFESASTWNDSIFSVNCGGFTILNFNDAGLNWAVHDAIPSADLIVTEFSFGASGYPLTWSHLDETEKREMMRERNENSLKSCRQLVELFDPEYVLPFAKFFTLAQPAHAGYRELLEKNTPADVKAYLSDTAVTVLDLFPGESWDGQTDTITRRPDRDEFVGWSNEHRAARAAYETMEPIVDSEFDLSHDELSRYFVSLSNSSLAREVGEQAISLTLTSPHRALHSLIRFDGGDITCEEVSSPPDFDDVASERHLKAELPGSHVQYVIRNDLS